MRSAVGPYAEIARLEALLNANSPTLDAERKEWEQTALTGGWSPVDVADVKSVSGTTLTKEPDGSVSASGNSPPTDTYTVVASTPLKQITAVRIEALPDERFPGNGPGRGANGNFILSRLQVSAQARAADGKAGEAVPVEFRSARATFEQQGWQAAGALDDRNDTGWGVAPNTGRPVSAVFTTRVPVAGDGGAVLTLVLEQQSTQPQHTLGRFRVWVTGSANPEATPSLPPDVAAALRVPTDKRNDEQKATLAAYHRTLAPSLQEVRERLAELKSKAAPLPLTVARNRPAFIPVPVTRNGDGPRDRRADHPRRLQRRPRPGHENARPDREEPARHAADHQVRRGLRPARLPGEPQQRARNENGRDPRRNQGRQRHVRPVQPRVSTDGNREMSGSTKNTKGHEGED